MSPRLQRFLQLSRAEQARTLEALVVVPAVLAARRVFSFRRVARWLGAPIATASPTPRADAESRDERHVAAAAAVDRALGLYSAREGQCLQRSLALACILRRDRPRIRLGARLIGGQLEAHAWVEVDGRIVGEPSATTTSFAPLSGEWRRSSTVFTD